MKTQPKLKLAVIYDPHCPKLSPTSYSATYSDMLNAVVERFDLRHTITSNCSAEDIDADVILVYDIHSSHKMAIDGLEKHKAVKYTYFNDPHQHEFKGTYQPSGLKVHKLGPEKRVRRAVSRGIDFVICPYKNGYYEHIAPWLGGAAEEMLFWFPPAPSIKRFPQHLRTIPLAERTHKILGNGFMHGGYKDGYAFREWAFKQKNTYYVKHAAIRSDVPSGSDYVRLLTQFTGALALCSCYVVPKYLEIPLAGCVCFAQPLQDYEDMGFRHLVNCFHVGTRTSYELGTTAFLKPEPTQTWQHIADAGRKLIEDKWTAEHFADAFYNHALERVQPNSKGQ